MPSQVPTHVLIWLVSLLLVQASLGEPRHTAKVELSCRILVSAQPGLHGPGRFLLEIQTPFGENIFRESKLGGQAVRLKGLEPGIYLACVSDGSGNRRCESWDLYPSPDATPAQFSFDLVPPTDNRPVSQLFIVGKAELTIPVKAKQQFDRFLREQRRGRALQALRYLDTALEIQPDYPEALINRGAGAYIVGDYDKAMEAFKRVTEIAPEHYAGWLNLGVSLMRSGRTREALEAEKRALQLRPDDPFVLYQIGLCHFRLREFDKARQVLERVVELDPGSATYPHLCLARIAIAESRFEAAEELVNEMYRLHPYSPKPPELESIVKALSDRLGTPATESMRASRSAGP